MLILKLLVLGLVIGANNLATALALGALGQTAHRVRIVLVFGLFEFGVPLVGMELGHAVAHRLADRAEWLGPTLLVALGSWMSGAGFRSRRADETLARRMTHWGGLILLAATLSLDNLIVGFSLGLERLPPLGVAGTIAVFSMVFTAAGMALGHELRRHWEVRAETAAGLLLCALGMAGVLDWL